MGSGNILKLFQPKEGRITAIKCFEKMLYAISEKDNSVLVYKKNENEGYSFSNRIPIKLKNAAGITTDGKTLFIADGIEKIVYSIDGNEKQASVLFSMRELEGNKVDSIINARCSRIGDIEILDGEMWVTCPAGYSSCIYRIDMDSHKVIKAITARGPEPKSISLDVKAGCMSVLDSSNKEISDFSFKGEWTGRYIRVPVDYPVCFSIDSSSNLVIASYSNNINREIGGVGHGR